DAVRFHLRHLRLEGKSETTIYHRQKRLEHLAAVLPVPLLEATAEQLYEWRASLKGADVTAATYISHIREFYAFAVRRGLIEADPAAGLPVPKLPRRRPRPIAENDLMNAVSVANKRVRIWLVLAGWCGMRAKEIALLRAENIRARDDQPHILIAFNATKGRRERIIPLSP